MHASGQKIALFDRIGGREELLRLLHAFYADVRQHNVIGPIFAARIKDWPAHLEIIADFWTRVTGGPSSYARSMPAKHLNLGLADGHFDAWLDLWRRHCRIRLQPNEAQEMIVLAEELAVRLRYIVNSARPDPMAS